MDKYYYELKVTPNNYYNEFIELISVLTDDAIEELDGSIILRNNESLEDIKEGIDSFGLALKNRDNSFEYKISISKKQNEDWIKKYKDSIKPVEVDNFYIYPSWTKPKEDKINILLDPALAFGSGHHETTSSCLIAISKYLKSDYSLMDVGCGSGILSISASKIGAVCDICDTDPLAIENAKENFKLNGVKFRNAWEGSVNLSSETYDMVIANIVADVLVMISNDLKKVLKSQGILILSGILSVYKDKVLKKFNEFEILEQIEKNEWTTLVLKRI